MRTYIDCTFVGTDLPESTPPDEAGEFEDCMHEFLVAVSEIPKPFDPENFPEGMIVTDAELVFLLRKHFSPLIERLAPRWIRVDAAEATSGCDSMTVYRYSAEGQWYRLTLPSIPLPPQKGST